MERIGVERSKDGKDRGMTLKRGPCSKGTCNECLGCMEWIGKEGTGAEGKGMAGACPSTEGHAARAFLGMPWLHGAERNGGDWKGGERSGTERTGKARACPSTEGHAARAFLGMPWLHGRARMGWEGTGREWIGEVWACPRTRAMQQRHFHKCLCCMERIGKDGRGLEWTGPDRSG